MYYLCVVYSTAALGQNIFKEHKRNMNATAVLRHCIRQLGEGFQNALDLLL